MGSEDNSALERLSQILNIPDLGGEDWDLMFADSERVDEFCDAYENAPLNADEKTALMELIVASYDWPVERSQCWICTRISRISIAGTRLSSTSTND